MKRELFIIVGLFAIVAGSLSLTAAQTRRPATRGQVALQAMTAPSVGPVSATPALVAANSQAIVTVTAQVDDVRAIPNSVNLIRLTGSTSTLVSAMADDGRNGDAVAGDRLYSARVVLSERSIGTVRLQVTVAFAGYLRRVTSDVISIDIGQIYSSQSGAYSITIPSSFNVWNEGNPLEPGSTSALIDTVSVTGYIEQDGSIDGYYINVWKLAPAGSLAEWVNNNDELRYERDRVSEATTIGGCSGLRVTSISRARYSVYVFADAKVYEIAWPGFTPEDVKGLEAFNMFLNTWVPSRS